MVWVTELLDRLAARYDWPYFAGGPPAAEPAALAALALAAQGRVDAAQRAGEALLAMQGPDGSVGVTIHQPQPCWPTGLAILAWHALASNIDGRFTEAVDRAAEFLTQLRGRTMQRHADFAHDSSLAGWPWVAGTHSWVEPTAWAVLALKAIGRGSHQRVREGVQLLIDRQLPGGGCNYGNTVVFGQRLLEHHQPTGLALTAVCDEPADPRIEQSRALLQRTWPNVPGTVSKCFVAIGLSSMQVEPDDLQVEMEQLYRRQVSAPDSPYRWAMLGLAALGSVCPLIPPTTALKAPESASWLNATNTRT